MGYFSECFPSQGAAPPITEVKQKPTSSKFTEKQREQQSKLIGLYGKSTPEIQKLVRKLEATLYILEKEAIGKDIEHIKYKKIDCLRNLKLALLLGKRPKNNQELIEQTESFNDKETYGVSGCCTNNEIKLAFQGGLFGVSRTGKVLNEIYAHFYTTPEALSIAEEKAKVGEVETTFKVIQLFPNTQVKIKDHHHQNALSNQIVALGNFKANLFITDFQKLTELDTDTKKISLETTKTIDSCWAIVKNFNPALHFQPLELTKESEILKWKLKCIKEYSKIITTESVSPPQSQS